jgi:hypothetical protein
MDVTKVDQDVAHTAYFCKCFQYYVASVLKKCFQMYVVTSVLSGCCICFYTYVASVLSGCLICCTYMLQVFYLDVAYV